MNGPVRGLAFGVERGPGLSLRVDPERAREMRAAGKTLREVARELGVGAATLHGALARHRERVEV